MQAKELFLSFFLLLSFFFSIPFVFALINFSFAWVFLLSQGLAKEEEIHRRKKNKNRRKEEKNRKPFFSRFCLWADFRVDLLLRIVFFFPSLAVLASQVQKQLKLYSDQKNKFHQDPKLQRKSTLFKLINLTVQTRVNCPKCWTRPLLCINIGFNEFPKFGCEKKTKRNTKKPDKLTNLLRFP